MNTFETQAYEATLETTDSTGTTVQSSDGTYFDVKQGKLVITTNSPSSIVDLFEEKVLSLRRLGPALHMEEEE